MLYKVCLELLWLIITDVGLSVDKIQKDDYPYWVSTQPIIGIKFMFNTSSRFHDATSKQ